ncbi:MAG: sugar-binding protein, partial [Clostridiales bacterium]|nr:sugar-binding protein [Clostridiales bacterium]
MKLAARVTAICGAAVLAFNVSGCAGGNSGTQQPAANDSSDTASIAAEPVTLKVWVPQNQVTPGTIDKMEKQFQDLHPEWAITFTTEVQGEDTAKDQILKDVAATGDVYFFANDQIQELIGAGAIAQLGGSTEQMVKDTMPEAVVDTCVVDGKLYGIPFTHNTFFMYYDKSLLTEDDVKSLDTIMAKQTPDNAYNFQFDDAGGWKGAAFYYGAGLTIYGADAVTYSEGCNWNNPTGIAVTNYLVDLVNNPKCVKVDDAQASELTAEHRLGAWWDGSWNYQVYKDALGDDLGMAPLPTFKVDGQDYQLKGFYGSKAIGVNAL